MMIIAGLILIALSIFLVIGTYKAEGNKVAFLQIATTKLLASVKYVWNSGWRWWIIVPVVILGIIYGFKGYHKIVPSPEPKPTSTMVTDKLVFVFNPPKDAKPPYRAEIVDHFLVETNKNDRVVFGFKNGFMKVFTIEGQKTIYRGLSKATRKLSDMPFHSRKSLEGPVYKDYKIDKISPRGKGFIVGGTEIEWQEKPCVLKVSTLKGNPMKLITDKVRFRFIPQSSLGSVPKN